MSHANGITRYSCTVGDCRGQFGDCMEKSKEGRWVTYEQHKRQIQQLQKEINRLKEGKKS